MNVLLERFKAIHAAHCRHISPAYLMSGLALLVGAIILIVFIKVHPAEPPAPSPNLLAERASEAQPLTPVPEAANPSGNITLSATPLPTGNILSSIPVGVPPDPLLADHSQRLDNLETLTAGLKTELTEVEVKLNQCQTTAEDLKKLQAKPPTSALPSATTQTTRRTRPPDRGLVQPVLCHVVQHGAPVDAVGRVGAPELRPDEPQVREILGQQGSEHVPGYFKKQDESQRRIVFRG